MRLGFVTSQLFFVVCIGFLLRSGYKHTALYNLSSPGITLLSMPAVRSTTTLGDRAFMLAAPTLWNSIPKELRAITNVNSFKAHIKTFFIWNCILVITFFIQSLLACIYIIFIVFF